MIEEREIKKGRKEVRGKGRDSEGKVTIHLLVSVGPLTTGRP